MGGKEGEAEWREELFKEEMIESGKDRKGNESREGMKNLVATVKNEVQEDRNVESKTD